jgi:pimeloyl-ACP methyl ester carboxylesterase
MAACRAGTEPGLAFLRSSCAVAPFPTTSASARSRSTDCSRRFGTQRGTPPSQVGPPYTIESHVADAVAVLDSFGLERAWAIGHSWGGHLALHLALANPERLLGLVLVDPLGADPDVSPRAGREPPPGLDGDAARASTTSSGAGAPAK